MSAQRQGSLQELIRRQRRGAFVGRRGELAAFRDYLATAPDDEAPLVSVYDGGPPGPEGTPGVSLPDLPDLPDLPPGEAFPEPVGLRGTAHAHTRSSGTPSPTGRRPTPIGRR